MAGLLDVDPQQLIDSRVIIETGVLPHVERRMADDPSIETTLRNNAEQFGTARHGTSRLASLSTFSFITQRHKASVLDANVDLPDARLPHLQAFSFLKSITFTRNKEEPDFAIETPAKVKALLPKVEVKFIKY